LQYNPYIEGDIEGILRGFKTIAIYIEGILATIILQYIAIYGIYVYVYL
jgi:hypothetical protein